MSAALFSLAEHVVAMADDAYLLGHPEWVEIVDEARKAIGAEKICHPAHHPNMKYEIRFNHSRSF